MSFLSALQVSTLSMQVGQLKRQVQDSSSEDIIKGVFTFHVSKSSGWEREGQKNMSNGLKVTLLLGSLFLTSGIFMLAEQALKGPKMCVHLMLMSLSDLLVFAERTNAVQLL